MQHDNGWALVLGASSGIGAAACRALAEAGHDVFGVHLDRRATLPAAEAVADDVRARGRRALFFNVNAADPDRRAEVLDAVASELAETDGELRLLLHSLAFGSLLPFVAPPDAPERTLTSRQLTMTLDVMAHSLVYWVQGLVDGAHFAEDALVLALTSEGATRVIPRYGAVAAAKAALESHVRQLAFELAPRRVRVNALRAGVTDTPALRRIPDHQRLLDGARVRNPSGRLTRPDDVAAAIVTLLAPGARWITGSVIGVDGGEGVVG